MACTRGGRFAESEVAVDAAGDRGAAGLLEADELPVDTDCDRAPGEHMAHVDDAADAAGDRGYVRLATAGWAGNMVMCKSYNDPPTN